MRRDLENERGSIYAWGGGRLSRDRMRKVCGGTTLYDCTVFCDIPRIASMANNCSGMAMECGMTEGWPSFAWSARRKQVSDSAGPCIAIRSSLREMTGRSSSTTIPSARNCILRELEREPETPARVQNHIRPSEHSAQAILRIISVTKWNFNLLPAFPSSGLDRS